MTKVFGVTGSVATGKTAVAAFFGRLGARVVDADAIVHRLMRPGTPAYRTIVKVFADAALKGKTKKIDRAKLGAIVFRDKRLLRRLSGIIHPVVIAQIKKQIRRARGNRVRVLVLDVPLLFEANLVSLVDVVIVVTARKQTQIARIRKKIRIPRQHIVRRIKSQMPLRRKIKMADYVIDNNGDLSSTRRQVRDIWNREVIQKEGLK